MRQLKRDNEQTPLVEEAAAWFLRIQDDDVSEEDFVAWRAWVSQSAAHAHAFDDIASLWKKSEGISDIPWPDEEALARDSYDGAAPLSPKAMDAARAGAPRRFVLGAMAATLAALVIGGALFGAMFLSPFRGASSSYETATGEHRTIYLEDGTEITLGAISRITVNYSDERRAVTLDYGESYFEVAKDPARPFVVTAGPRTVRAVGTAFNVKMGVKDVTVTVVEGQVQVGAEAPKNKRSHRKSMAISELELNVARVSVGQGVNYGISGQLGEVQTVDAELALSWRKGRLAFSNQSLEAVIADVNRYSRDKIMIGDAMAKQLMFTGTVFQDEIENWLEGLEKVFPVRVIDEGEIVFIIITKYDG